MVAGRQPSSMKYTIAPFPAISGERDFNLLLEAMQPDFPLPGEMVMMRPRRWHKMVLLESRALMPRHSAAGAFISDN